MSDCFHCGLAVAENNHYQLEIMGKNRQFCCIGCEAVAQAIVDNDLLDFYKFRTDKSENSIPAALQDLHIYDDEILQKSFVRTEDDAAIREASLILEGIVCAACVWLNEKHIRQLKGVLSFSVNYSTHRASLKWDNQKIQLSEVLQAISDIGYHAHPFDAGRLETLQKKEKSAALRRIAIAAIGMMQVMMLAIALYIGESDGMSENMQHFLRWISLIITTPVILFASRVFFVSAWRDIKRWQLGMDVPVAIAMGAAYSASVWATLSQSGEVYFDSVTMFTLFLLSGRYLEMTARHKAGQVADALVRLLPATANRINSQGEQESIAVTAIELHDQLLIKAGEIIPADGVVIEGNSQVNEALLTGESLPLGKAKGSKLIAGTVNIDSPITMQVEKLGNSTVLSSIIRLLERAQSEKPMIASLADRAAAWFVLALLMIAVVVFGAWSLISPSDAFWITLSVLVVTCPCALSLATPAAVTAATGTLTRKGLLTTRGHALESLANVNHIVFDKTGTLTQGKLSVTAIKRLGSASYEEVIALAMGLEQRSEHPIAAAIKALNQADNHLDQCLNKNLDKNLSASELSTIKQAIDNKFEFSDYLSIAGQGVEAQYQQYGYRLGRWDYVAEWLDSTQIDTVQSQQHQDNKQNQNHLSMIYLARQGELLAQFCLSDSLRPEALSVIQALKAQNIKVSLLSGDNQTAVDAVAQQLQIEHAIGTLLPADKLKKIRQWQAQGEVVAMVGDGVNDAPVLAGANVSLAMGSGSQLAQASADMIILSESLKQLPAALTLSRKMQSVIYQNFSWAIFYNLLAIPLAAMGWILPWMAAIGMSISSVLVVLNALRLRDI